MPKSGKISEHFTWEEARCRCRCEVPEDLVVEIEATARWAEEVRTRLGGFPIKVLSWYRCPAYNKQVGGVPNSQHLKGRAIDFVIREFHPRQVQGAIMASLYPTLIRGLGNYPGFTHIDRRDGAQAMWTPATRTETA